MTKPPLATVDSSVDMSAEAAAAVAEEAVGAVVHATETLHATESLESFMGDHGMKSYHSAAVKLLTLLGKV